MSSSCNLMMVFCYSTSLVNYSIFAYFSFISYNRFNLPVCENICFIGERLSVRDSAAAFSTADKYRLMALTLFLLSLKDLSSSKDGILLYFFQRCILYNYYILNVMINSQAMSLTQKQKFWRQHKQDRFKQMAGDKCALFNYFYNNNDIFHFIEETDYLVYSLYLYKVMEIQGKIVAGSVATVFLVDKFILNKAFPAYRFQKWRLTANLIKYLFWPTCIFKVVDHFYLKKYREDMFTLQDRYKFGFRDYMKGNQIFERALAVNRLEQLLQKRNEFDWSDVPQIVK